MDKIFVTIFFVLVFSIFSCKQNEEVTEIPNESVEIIDISHIQENQKYHPFFSGDLLDSCRFVRLETTDDCLIGGDIKQLLIDDGNIFVLDINKKVFVFSEDGNFLTQIGTIGGGPKEMMSPSVIYLNKKNKHIGVFDSKLNKLFQYTYSGELVNVIACDRHLFSMVSHMGMLGDDFLYVGFTNSPLTKYNSILIKEKDFSFSGVLKDFLCHNKKVSVSGIVAKPFVSGYGFFLREFSDTIYSFKDMQVQPIFLLKTKYKLLTADVINTIKPKDDFEFRTYLTQNGYSVGISEIMATDEYLKIDYENDDVFYHFKTGSIYVSSKRSSPFYSFNLKTTTDNAFVGVVYMDRINIAIDNNNGDIGQFFKRSNLESVGLTRGGDEEDNPVLIYIYTNNEK